MRNFTAGSRTGGAGLGPALRRGVLVAVLLVSLGGVAFGQMDMLPQIFRDLPPELQEGLPEQMSFAEYRALNRNVDFFTMFMSMFVPGYGLFQVERPQLAWTMVGARATGYGLIATGVALQWNHFYSLVEQPVPSSEDFQRLLTNGLIAGTGVMLAGVTWAADVVLAYQIAKNDKNLVQYKYGIRSSIYGSGRGGSDAASDETFLRRLLSQEGDRRLEEQLLADLPEYARRYPDAAFSGEALYFAALLHAERGEDPDALRYAIRSAYLYPDGDRVDDALRLAARLLERNRRWGIAYDDTVELSTTPADRSLAARFLAGIRGLSRFDERELNEAAVAEVRAFLTQYGSGDYVADGLALAADLLLDVGRVDEAAGYLAALAVNAPQSDQWPAAVLKLAELYLGPLRDRGRAEILLEALVENRPDSPQAAEARDLMNIQ
ncbi:MAG: tetratricopeptide repeat protein [Spirochaetota bacterium]